jgi:two-component system, chemotaxis family, protein-glutamate methylesterase/glutaminase
MPAMVKVLVVDDSALMRRYLTGMLEGAGGFDVVTARDGADALEQVRSERPDVVTLDINMPRVNGLDCLARIMEDNPCPVVMVSSLTTDGALATLEALELGAVDYVAKPGGTVSLNIDAVAEEFIVKVRAASRARVRGAHGAVMRLRRSREAQTGARPASAAPRSAARARGRAEIVVIGASTGGPGVLGDVLGPLPAHFGAPIIIAQHIPAGFSETLARRLDQTCAVRVEEVDRPRELEPGLVLIARGGADVVVSRRGGRMVARSVPSDPSLRWHPSVERLVRSITDVYKPEGVVAVQLTGMGDDGAEAIADLYRAGGHTIAESEESAVVWGMPGEVVRRGAASEVLSADAVPGALMRWS